MSDLRDHSQPCEHGYFRDCPGGEPYRGDLPRLCPGGRVVTVEGQMFDRETIDYEVIAKALLWTDFDMTEAMAATYAKAAIAAIGDNE